MNTTVRSIVVSAATIAVLGLAGTATAADQTTPAHHQAVIVLAAAAPAAAVQPATNTVPTVQPANAVVPASTGTAVGVGGTAILLLGAGVVYAVRKAGHKVGWMLCSFALGVLLAGGALGSMTQQAVSGAVTAVASFGGNLS
jgi:hypothetical protein